MYRDTITLFNRYKSSAGDLWYPSVLHNVHLNMDKSAVIAKYGAESKDKVMLNIQYRDCAGAKMIGGKIFLPPKEWNQQEEDQLPDSLTFTEGQRFDFFYAGEWPDTDPVPDDDYTEGFYNHVNASYDYVFAITAVNGPYSVIPHFEITGA